MRAIFLSLLLAAASAVAAEEKPAALEGVGIDPKLGSILPLDEEFRDESGRTVKLREYFAGEKPVALILNYYGCPMLCGMLLNAARDSFQNMNWLPGDHYKVVTISIDPKEGSDLASSKKSSLLESLKDDKFRKAAESNWHFLVGKNGSEARLAAAMGFGYKWIEDEKQYAHGAALYLASPTGRLTRVLLGLDFPPRDLKLALLEAGEGKVGNFAEKLLLFCYHYEPKDNKYALLASRLMSLGGALMVAVLLVAFAIWFFRQRGKGNACSHCP